VAGTRASIEAMTRDQIASFHAEWYHPANIVVSAAGLVDHDELVELVTKRFGDLDGGPRPTRTPPVRAGEPVTVVRRRCEQVHLAVGLRALSLYDDDRWTGDVVEHLLGGGASSRLFQSIREERGLAYAVYAASSEWSDGGQLVVYAGTSPERWAEVLRLLQAELDRFAADGPTLDELERTKRYLEGAVLLSAESVGETMSGLGRSVLNHDLVLSEQEHLDRYRAVTLDDVRRVTDRILTGPRTIAAVGPVTKKAVTNLVE
jgi:predicted Zn-dependent peptidase